MKTLLLISLLFFASCECVERLGPGQNIPVESAHVTLIHAHIGLQELSYKNSGIDNNEKLEYNLDYFLETKMVAGKSSLMLSSGTEILYNGVVEFEKDASYTVPVFGTGTRINTLVIKNETPDNQLSYLRLLNLANTEGEIKFEIKLDGDSEFILGYKDYTELVQYLPGNLEIIAKKGEELLAELSTTPIRKGYIYNAVFRGQVDSKNMPPELILIETAIPAD